MIAKILSFLVVVTILFFPISAPIALLVGIVIALIWERPLGKKSGKMTSVLLKAAIVGLGFGINIDTALQASKDGLLLTVITILIAVIIGWGLGRLLGLSQKLSFLLSSGTAICGGSAIAAVSPVIEADEEQMSVSLGVVFILNAIGLLVFPYIGEYLAMSQEAFGTWAAVAIHDTSSVVGAAKVYGERALEIATSVKLARTLWIIPLSVFAAFLFKSKSKKIKFPVFIGLFIAAIAIGTYLPEFQFIKESIPTFAKKLMVVAIFMTGASLSPKNIKKTGANSFLSGTLIWLIIAFVSYLWVRYFLVL